MQEKHLKSAKKNEFLVLVSGPPPNRWLNGNHREQILLSWVGLRTGEWTGATERKILISGVSVLTVTTTIQTVDTVNHAAQNVRLFGPLLIPLLLSFSLRVFHGKPLIHDCLSPIPQIQPKKRDLHKRIYVLTNRLEVNLKNKETSNLTVCVQCVTKYLNAEFKWDRYFVNEVKTQLR